MRDPVHYQRNRPPFEDDERLAELARDILLDEPSPAQAKVISAGITELEELTGVELDDEDFQRVGRLAFEELGGDVAAAFGLVFDEVSEEEDAWQADFDAQLEAKQEELGRTLAPSEIERLKDAHEDVSDPDLNTKFKEIWSGGKGEFDLDTAEGRTAYAAERMTPEPEATVEPLSPDATSAERAEHINKRFAGAEVENE